MRRGPDDDAGKEVASPEQVEALYEAMPDQWAIAVLLAAWCQLRRGECLGLQRRDVEWHADGSATLHVRRQLNAHNGDLTDPKSDAGKRSLSVPRFMVDRLREHLRDHVEPEAKDVVDSVHPKFRFHDLQPTGLTIFAQEGATLAELMRRGGHSNIRIVLRYQHATMTRDRELANRMSDRVDAALDFERSSWSEPPSDSEGYL